MHKDNPLVSVITPTYNRPEYLKQALTSAVQQTYSQIEIIVSDNCSPEDPRAIVESFNDPRIRYERNSTNLGMLANTINTFKKAKGKYVASLLDDDLWEKDYLQKLVPPLEANPNLALAFCDHYVIDSHSQIDAKATEKFTQFYQRQDLQKGVHQPFRKLALVDQAVSPAIAAVIRREVVDWEEFCPEVGGMWDIYLSYLCSRSGMGAYYYPERLTRYREHDQTDTKLSGSRNAEAKIRKATAEMFCYEKFIQDEHLQEFQPFFLQKWLHANTTMGIGLIRTQQITAARPYLWRALKFPNINLRTLAAIILSFTPSQLVSRV